MADYVGQQFGHYRLLRLLGQGGFADVYLGEHIHLKSFAAIKILYARLIDEYHERFISEARTLAHLTHPHIVRLLDFGIEGGIPFLIMEYAPHGTVRQRHPPKTKVPLSTVVDYVNQIADGLQYAHDQNLIHRDLKPSNVLIGQRNNLLLSDFGVALLAQTTYSQSVENSVVGTIAYVAPEQLQGKPQLASDQYSLGVIAYEWLCGTRPFLGSVIEMWAQHQSAVPAPLRQYVPDLPPEVEQVVLTALAKDPSQRFANVRAFATALEAASRPEHVTVISAPSKSSIQAHAVDQESIRLKAIDGGYTPLPADITDPDEAAPSPHSSTQTTHEDVAAMRSGGVAAPAHPGRKKRMGMIAIVALVLLLITSTLVYAINNGGIVSPPTTQINQSSNGRGLAGKKTLSPTATHIARPTPTRHPRVTPTVPAILPTAAPPTHTATPTPVPPPPCPATIQYGAKGSLVKTLQQSLNDHYAAHAFPNSPYNFSPPLVVDGDFGTLTQSALKDYQTAKGLEVDGVAGPKTWHSLGYC